MPRRTRRVADINPTPRPVAGRRRLSRRSTRSSTPSAASTATATASTSSPTRSRPTPRPRVRGAREDQPGHSGPCREGRNARLRRRPPAPRRRARRPPGRARRARRRRGRRRRPGRDQAAVPLRRPLLRARRRGELGRSMEATRSDWRIALKEGDTVSIDATYDVSRRRGTSRWGSCRSSISRPRRPAAKDPFDDDAAVQAMYDAGGILTHGRLPENIDKKARKNLKLPDPARPARARDRVPRTGVEINGFELLARAATRRCRGFPDGPHAPADDRAGPERHLHQPRRATRTCPTTIRPGTASPRARRPATAARGSATRSRTGRSSSTPASSATAPDVQRAAEVTTGSNVYTTPPLTKPGQDLHVLLPDPPVHARLGPGQGQPLTVPLRRDPGIGPGRETAPMPPARGQFSPPRESLRVDPTIGATADVAPSKGKPCRTTSSRSEP